MTKWNSNEPLVLANIDDSKKLSAFVEPASSAPNTKTLGLIYDPNEDTFSINFKAQQSYTFTKRGMLSAAASLYDPIGWYLPVIMTFRILLQDLWRNKYDWDDMLENQRKLRFEKCLEVLPLLSNMKIPRWTGQTNGSTLELIGFCDASAFLLPKVVLHR